MYGSRVTRNTSLYENGHPNTAVQYVSGSYHSLWHRNLVRESNRWARATPVKMPKKTTQTPYINTKYGNLNGVWQPPHPNISP